MRESAVLGKVAGLAFSVRTAVVGIGGIGSGSPGIWGYVLGKIVGE